MGLVPPALRGAAADILAADIRGRGMTLSTGFLGTPYLLDVLADAGKLEDRKSTRLNFQSLMRISYAVFCLKKKNEACTDSVTTKYHIQPYTSHYRPESHTSDTA